MSSVQLNEYQNYPSYHAQNLVNTRLSQRNIPSSSLQPYLESRPVSTKYSTLPVVDQRSLINEPLVQKGVYNPSQTFNPGSARAPVSGYLYNIDKESELRNQNYALQRCNQAYYVPGSKSDLYNYKWNNSNHVVQPFPELFTTPTHCAHTPNANEKDIGGGMFNNATRQQLKDLTPRNQDSKTMNINNLDTLRKS